MYNPYENNSTNNQNTDQNKDVQKPAAPGYGTGNIPYTAQTHNPENSEAAPAGSPEPTAAGVPVGSPYTPKPTASPYGTPGIPQSQARPAYTWNPQASTQQPPVGPYYTPAQQAPKKKKEKKRGARFGVKVLAAVLVCAVVSFSSVGVFALMIQTGVVNVQSTGESNKTAAFTLYKLENSDNESTPTATGQSMTAQEVAEKLIPSVVLIQNYQISQQQNYFFGGMEGQDNTGSEVSPAGEGSGIIISKDGYIVTNQHVIDGATSIKVVTSEGLTYEAELVGEDTQTDLAVLKINTEDELTPADFGSSQDLKVADEVMAIGNPGGSQLNSSVTMGYVSALNRQVTNSETGYSINCIQTDAAINPGNSGGALVDMNGHVVGINSSKIVATGYEGLGFAIPSDTVQPIVSDLIEYGYVKDRPMLGIYGQYIDRMTASFYGLSQGYYVDKVTSDEATKSGLQRGDVITAIDDTQVTSASTISAYISDKKPGDQVTLTVSRALSGEEGVKIELTLSENTGSTE